MTRPEPSSDDNPFVIQGEGRDQIAFTAMDSDELYIEVRNEMVTATHSSLRTAHFHLTRDKILELVAWIEEWFP